MERLRNFGQNAGFSGVAQILVVLVLVAFTVLQDLQTGLWIYSLPILGTVFLIAFLVRELLVEHITVARWIMNTCAIAGIATFLYFRNSETPLPLGLELFLTGFVGLYAGCYFMMLSDPRVAVSD